MALPNLAMSFTPFDILTAAELNDLVENIEALAAGTGLNTSAVTTTKIANGNVTAAKLALGGITNEVITGENTASAAFVALTTPGPAVTATIGPGGVALVIVHAFVGGNIANLEAIMGFVISGASTVAASDSFSARRRINDAFISGTDGLDASFLVTGLTAGANIFTAVYKVSAGTGRFAYRKITVIPLG